jgi:diaminopimelate decarboxylase
VLAALVQELVQGLDVELVLEPGRALVAEAGALVATVIYRKDSGGRRFLVLDAGMNVLIRPALYGAYHEVLPLAEPPAGAHLERMDVVGPICESSDIFGRDRYLPLLDSGDRVAILSAGAYGAVMASPYNSRWGAAEVLVDGSRWALIRPRRAPAAQFADEVIPAWLDAGLGSAGGA